jgi:hypothetical protein
MISARLLLIMAQTWLVVGSLSLVFGSYRLFGRALDAGLSVTHVYWIAPVAILIGFFKARVVMRKRMRANIARLSATKGKLWPWQLYPPQLLIFIFAMVAMMAVLKRVFVGNGAGLGALGGVDLLVAVALAVASLEYRKSARPAAVKAAPTTLA